MDTMNEEQLVALTAEERSIVNLWSQGEGQGTDDVLLLATALADARLEIARLTEERDDARSRLRLEQSSVRNCDRFLVDTTRKCDQQREDIRRLLWLVEAYIRVYPNNSGNAIRVVAELKERYDA